MSVEIKICGLTNVKDALAALMLGADYLGFVLFHGTPRGIDVQTFLHVRARLPGNARVVAVLVNATRAWATALVRAGGLHAVQLHGDEQPGTWNGFPLPLWRAVRLCAPHTTSPTAPTLEPAPAAWPATRYVLDAAVPGRYGGTGQTVDWESAAGAARQVPLMLAGGLTPANVAPAIRRVRPCGVDVASGIETVPGRKDHAKMRAFITAVRRAQRMRS